MAPARGLNPPGGRGAGDGPGRPGQPRASRRARSWLALLMLVPLVEIVVAILVGQAIGGWLTFVLLLALSLLGLVLVRREGRRTWSALNTALRSGAMPAREIADAVLVLVGGVLLLTPGFVTAVVGLFFLLPFTRPVTRRWLELAVGRRLLRTPGVPPTMGGPSGRGGPSSGQRPGDRPPGAGSGPDGRGSTRKPPPDDDIIEGEIL